MKEIGTIPQALEDLKNGKVILVIDDPDRENEGDLICAAEFATQENVNFMASNAKGLICMPMSKEWCQKLDLQQMVSVNTDNHSTAFTVSIDHVDTTTGISAYERSYTAMKTVEDGAKPEDFRRPGHMFPLEAREGGVLKRAGHTEATVDLVTLAGLKPVGLCCEIMREDGTMMRTTELLQFADEHNLTDMFQLCSRSFRFPVKHIILVLGSDIIKPRKDIEFFLAWRNLCHRIERTLGFRHPDTFQLALVVDKRAHGVGLDIVESDQRAVLVVDREEDRPHIAYGIAASDLSAEEISKHIGGGHLIVVCGVLHEFDGESLSEDVGLTDRGVVHKRQDLLTQELPLSVPEDRIAVHRHARVFGVEDQ